MIDATKKCPMCAEQVQADARICRYCRHEFPQYQYRQVPLTLESHKLDGRSKTVVRIVGVGLVVLALGMLIGLHSTQNTSVAAKETTVAADAEASSEATDRASSPPAESDNGSQSESGDGVVSACDFNKSISGTKTQCAFVNPANIVAGMGKVLPYLVSAPKLSVAYIQNQVAADKAFSFKPMHIYGPVTAITDDESAVTIEFAAPYEIPVKANLWQYQVVNSKIVTDRDAAAQFSRGQTVFMFCFNRSVNKITHELSLVNCMIENDPTRVAVVKNVAASVPQPNDTDNAASAANQSPVDSSDQQ